MSNFIKNEYVIDVGKGRARIDLTEHDLYVITILLEKLAIYNKSNFKITAESGEVLLDLNSEE